MQCIKLQQLLETETRWHWS